MNRDDDWRLTGQEKYLKGVTLVHRKYRQYAKNPSWDHDHCEFCWGKFSLLSDPDHLKEGYATEDEYRWICPQCFIDFKERFRWKLMQKSGVYVFGEKSKVANWVLNHPFHIAAFGVLLGTPLLASDKMTPISSLILNLVFFLGLALFLRFICRNLCYRVELDTGAEKVRFFRCFNKAVIEAPLRSVEFVFDNHFACLYGGERFTVFNEYIGGIAEVLPSGMGIRFSDGFYGRFMKRQFERYRNK